MSQHNTKPFAVDPILALLQIRYPDSQFVKRLLAETSDRGRQIFIRLWLSEGEPYAFRNCPAIFDEIRGWLGDRLLVHPKEVTLIGSARIGYSLAKEPKFGKPYSGESDLDWMLVSSSLFGVMENEFNLFKNDYRNGVIVPKSDSQKRYWEDNINFGDRNFKLGFFDANKIPPFTKYKVTRKIQIAMEQMISRLSCTLGAPDVKRASLRLYRDWGAFVNRALFNLKLLIR
jgi:hypothetical protein